MGRHVARRRTERRTKGVKSMWVRKTDERKVEVPRNYWLSFRDPAILFFIVTGIMFGAAISGGRKGTGPQRWPSTWSEVPNGSFIRSAILGAVAAAVGYIVQLVRKRQIFQDNVTVKVMMCNTCHRVKRADGVDQCQCGGTFEDFDDWTWVDKSRSNEPH